MDSNDTLRVILSLCRDVENKAMNDNGEEDYSMEAVDLAQNIRSLDQWVLNGGFLPARWQKKKGG